MGNAEVGVIVMETCRSGSTIKVGIDRKSSIEKEPRTLTVDQIQYAREAALSVLNTRSIEEAMTIFTEGLKPVASAGRELGKKMMDISGEMNYLEDEEEMRRGGLRDIVSAPF